MRFDNNIYMFLLTPETARDIALELLAGVNSKGKPDEWKEVEFRSHCGTSSGVIAHQCYDLCTTDIECHKPVFGSEITYQAKTRQLAIIRRTASTQSKSIPLIHLHLDVANAVNL
jgi:hypothetical protein